MTSPPRPSDVPRIHREIAGEARRLVRSDGDTATLGDVGATPTQRVTNTLHAIADRARFADRFLVSAEMTRVAVDAARDIPPMLVTEAQPSFDGALVYAGGLPPVPVPTAPGATLTPEVLVWTRANRVPVLTLWARTKVDGRPRWVCPVIAEISDPEEVTDPDEFARPVSGSTYALAMATWHLMTMPTVAEQRTSGPPVGSGRRGKGVAGGRQDQQVKVVELRRLARKGHDDEMTGGGGRSYRHQWIVRGHWRQQPVGEGRRQRRTTWVPSHVKGPEGAPLLNAETVFVWRR